VPDGVADESSFLAGAWDATEYADQHYSVPLYVDTRVLFYRKDLAAAAGVEAPTTWADIPAFAQGLKAAGAADGLLTPTGETGFTHQVLLPYVFQAGGEILSEDGTEFTLDTPEVVAGLAQYQSLFTSGASSNTGTYEPWGSVEERLFSGEVGSVVNGPWLIGSLKELFGDEYDAKIGAVTLPTGPSTGESWLDAGQMSVFRDAANPEGAWKFIKFLSQADSQATFNELTTDLPAVSAAWDEADLADDWASEVFQQQFESAEGPPVISTWNELSTIVDSYGEQLARGTITPEKAASEMQQKFTTVGVGS